MGLNPARRAPGIGVFRARVRGACFGSAVAVRMGLALLCLLLPPALRAGEPGAGDPSRSAAAPSTGEAGAVAEGSVANVEGDALAAVCATCHRPDGNAIPVIHGRPAAELERMLTDFPARTDVTVMHRLSQGLSPAEIAAVAQRLSEARRP